MTVRDRWYLAATISLPPDHDNGISPVALAPAVRYVGVGRSRTVPLESADRPPVRLDPEPRAAASLASPRVSRGWFRPALGLCSCRALWRAGSMFVTMLRPDCARRSCLAMTMSQSRRAAASVTAIVVALCMLSACVSIGTPRVGEPVTIQQGEALVFGRIRMLDAENEKIEYSPFWFDPWDQPFFVQGPWMTLELRQLHPPGGLFRYKAYPAPPIEKNGSFLWILSAGDYGLLGNPRLLGSKRFTDEETETLARFSVAGSGETIYLGTLIVSIVFDLEDFIYAWRTGEAEYTIRSCRVVDEREQELSRLRERFPALPEPVVTELMRAASSDASSVRKVDEALWAQAGIPDNCVLGLSICISPLTRAATSLAMATLAVSLRFGA